jgi:hypothetical protein
MSNFKFNLLARAVALVALASTSFAQANRPDSVREPSAAPEINVALGGAALALVIGGVLLLTTARRKRLARS